MHFAELLLSEVAVNGLEGVTVNQLWHNLKDDRLSFPWRIDDDSKQFIWSTLMKMRNIRYYVMPRPVALRETFSRIDCLVEMKDGTYYKLPDSLPQVKFFPVTKDGVFGSSEYYEERKDITEVIHNDASCDMLQNVNDRWGDTLVLVASQKERNRFLFGNPNIPRSFSTGLYVMVEAIAKHKYNGLSTTHYDGLLSSGMATGTIWYMRQKLEKMGVIKSQPYLMKVGKKPVMPGLLLHHRKYYIHFPFPPAIFMDRITQFLLTKPKNKCFGFEIRKFIGITSKGIKRTLKFGARHGWLDVINISFRGACAVILDKNEDDIDDEDMLNLLQKTNCAIDPHHRYPCMVNLVSLIKPFSMDSWISECGQGENAFGFKKCRKEEYDIDSDDAFDEEYEAVDDQLELSSVKPDNPDNTEFKLKEQQAASSAFDTQISMNTSFCLPVSSKVQCLVYAKRLLAFIPSLNIDESIAVQIVRILIINECTMAELLAVTKTTLSNLRRTLKSLVTIGALKAVKRSMDSTFVLYYSIVTDADRIETLKVKSTKTLPVMQALPTVQTQRQNRRAFVLDYLEKYRVIASEYSLRQLIWDHERSIGLKIRMDRKSLRRILEELIQAKLATIIRTKSLKGDVTFICQPDIKEDDPLILTAIKNMDLAAIRNLPLHDEKSTTVVFSADQVSRIEGINPLSSEAMTIVLHKMPLLPKMRRRSLVHEYLFHVIYGLSDTPCPIKPQTKSEPPVFCDDDTWRRYVAPLEHLRDMKNGWFLIGEVLRGIPFGLYLRLTITTSLPRILCRWLKLDNLLSDLTKEEVEHLDSELTRFYNANMINQKDVPVRDLLRYPLRYVELPGGSRGLLNDWLLSAKKLRTVSAMIEDLSGVTGLVSMQQRNVSQAKTSMLGFLHRRASLLDTRTAVPAYQILTNLEHTEVIQFDFQTAVDVASYWLTCETIARNTPLGHNSCKDKISSEFLPPLIPRVSAEPVDDGALIVLNWPEEILSKFKNVLSDGTELYPCGACGYHPIDCTYNARNWGATRNVKSKRKGDADRLLYLLEEFTGLDDACGFTTPSDEPFWPWFPSLFSDLHVPAVLKPVDTPHVVRRRSCARRSLRNNRPYPDGNGFNKRNETREVNPVSPNTAERPEARDTDSILKDIRRQNLLDASVNHRNVNQHLSKDLSSSENKENVINSLSSHVLSSFTPSQTVVVRRIRGILKQHGRKQGYAQSGPYDLYLRAPRCSWSKLEDRLLITCRIASVLIAGETRREYITAPYTFVRDVLHRYIPQLHYLKTPVACARRLKALLLSKGPEWVSGKLLFSRVSSRPDWQLKYNYGRDKWRIMCKDETEQARLIFLELVHSIVNTFMPQVLMRLNSLTTGKRGNHVAKKSEKPFNQGSDKPLSIGSSRAEMESTYDLIPLYDPSDQNGLPEVGNDRLMIVLYTMYNFILAAFRFSSDQTESSAFNESLFLWVIKHYPKAQVNHAIALLMKNHIIKRPKSYEKKSDPGFRSVNSVRIALSHRFSRWTHGEFTTQTKYIHEAYSIWLSGIKHLSLYRNDDVNMIDKASATVSFQSTRQEVEVVETDQLSTRLIHRHLFGDVSTGGCVAFFLELLLFYPFVNVQVSIRVEDIILVGSNQTCPDDPVDLLSLQTIKQNSAMRLKPTELRKDLLYRMGVSNDVLNDPLFVGDYNFMRHSRWFDHHLSFTGGYIQAVLTDSNIDGSLDTSWSLLKFSEANANSLKPLVQSASNSIVFQIPDSGRNCVNTSVVQNKMGLDVDLDMSTEESLSSRLEDYIQTGRFSGRSISEIKENIGDRKGVLDALQHLLDTHVVFNIGSNSSRFVHQKHIRLWLVHLKPNINFHSNVKQNLTEVVKLDDPESTLQPKRAKLDQALTETVDNQTDPNSSSVDNLPSELFAQQHQTLFGQQAIRQLLCFLRDIGAIRMVRVVASSQACLFSDPVTYSVSDDILLASPEELTLIPEPNYVTLIGTFTDLYIQQNSSINVNDSGSKSIQ
ncbi:unnamed protein product [Heterobilharzia americana]|nr:unnamed protein product [Heterobilharzia americana]